jgi:hypothetical protein
MSLRPALRLSLAAVLVAACADGTTPTDPSLRAADRAGAAKADNAAGVNQLLAATRAATAKYHDLDAALADGYIAGSPCVSHPTLGTMGFHYVNPAMIADPSLAETKPEVLVYEPKANGGYKLVAVEYLVPAMGPRPSLFGQAFENGPPLPTPNGMVPTYALHAWVWQPNPSGMFAAFNPTVSCADAPAPTAADVAAHAHH